jgi:hypothetical protein
VERFVDLNSEVGLLDVNCCKFLFESDFHCLKYLVLSVDRHETLFYFIFDSLYMINAVMRHLMELVCSSKFHQRSFCILK